MQTLEPVTGPNGPALKNEMMLPAVLDPWAASALYEAANLAAKIPGSKVWLVSLGPKAKLQQVMMTIAQKVSFELVAIDGASRRVYRCACTLRPPWPTQSPRSRHWKVEASAVWRMGIGCARCGCDVADWWASVSASPTSSWAWTRLNCAKTDRFEVLERVEGGKHQVSECAGTPAVLGWATGNLPEPRNNPQIGMANMRTVMPALQKAKPTSLADEWAAICFSEPSKPATADTRSQRYGRRRTSRRNSSSGLERSDGGIDSCFDSC